MDDIRIGIDTGGSWGADSSFDRVWVSPAATLHWARSLPLTVRAAYRLEYGWLSGHYVDVSVDAVAVAAAVTRNDPEAAA